MVQCVIWPVPVAISDPFRVYCKFQSSGVSLGRLFSVVTGVVMFQNLLRDGIFLT